MVAVAATGVLEVDNLMKIGFWPNDGAQNPAQINPQRSSARVEDEIFFMEELLIVQWQNQPKGVDGDI